MEGLLLSLGKEAHSELQVEPTWDELSRVRGAGMLQALSPPATIITLHCEP